MAGFNPQDYETVDSRLHRFWDDIKAAKLTATIETELLDVARAEDGRPLQYLTRTTIAISDGRRATGLAEELVGSSPVNRTSALENAETSSTGRALAQLGYSPKGARPSAEEMGKAARVESARVEAAAPKSNGNGKAPKAAVKPASEPAPTVTATAVIEGGNKATPEQWGRLLQRFGSNAGVVKAARARFEDAVSQASDITFLQAEALLEGGK